MRAAELSELSAFEAVARHRSFSRAAAERHVTASAISHAVSQLEQRLGIRLLNRTTRSVSTTDAGTRLLALVGPALAEIGSALEAVNEFRDTPFGKIRLNVPNSIAPFILGEAIGVLVRDNPRLEIEVVATDRLVDIVEGGFDAGIRLGESLRDGMIAVRIKPQLRLVVVGAPSYFETRGVPQTPHDLSGHVGIRNLYPSGVAYPWAFARDGTEISWHPTGPIALDDHLLMLTAARSGVTLAYVWEQAAATDIAAGRLVQCLDEWCQPEDWPYIYYPSRRNMPAGLRALIELIRA